MKSIKQQYIDLQEGKMSQSNFMRNVRMTLPQFITNITSYDDTVRILKNKGIITEAVLNLAGNLKVGDKLKKINTSAPGTVTIKKIDGNKIFVEDEAIPGRLFQWAADGIEAEIKAGKLKLQTPTEEGNNPEEDTMGDDEVDNILKQLDAEEDAKHTAPNIRALSEARKSEAGYYNQDGKEQYAHFKEIDNLNGQEVFTGITCEMENNPELTKKEATKIVIKNLKKQPNYYTDYKLSGVEGYEPKIIGDVDPKTRQMKAVASDNLVDKAMGMKPVKNVAKAKASANKAKKETNKAKDIDVLSLVAQTLRGVDKMQSQGEKSKTIKLRETIQKLVKEVMNEKEQKFDNYDEWLDALYKTHPFIKGNEDKYFRKDEYFTNVSRGLESFGYWYNGKAKDPKPAGRVYASYDVSSNVYPQGSRKD
jgi:hypothetical protein